MLREARDIKEAYRTLEVSSFTRTVSIGILYVHMQTVRRHPARLHVRFSKVRKTRSQSEGER